MKHLKKYSIGYNTVTSTNGVISAKGVKSKPNNLEIFGYTHEIGEGEKSPDNPYQLISLDSGAMTVDSVDYEHSIVLSNNDMSIQVPVPISLNNFRSINDYIFKDSDGIWKLIQNNEKYIYIGTESISIQSINNFGIVNFLHVIDNAVYEHASVICNLLKAQTSVIADTNSEGFLRTRSSSTRSKLLYLRIKLERASTVEEFKTFLAEQYENGTPLTIIYQLETPITHVLSDYAQQLLNSFEVQNQNKIFVEGYPSIKISGYIQK